MVPDLSHRLGSPSDSAHSTGPPREEELEDDSVPVVTLRYDDIVVARQIPSLATRHATGVECCGLSTSPSE